MHARAQDVLVYMRAHPLYPLLSPAPKRTHCFAPPPRSFIIGLTLGTALVMADVRVLLIVLCIHQVRTCCTVGHPHRFCTRALLLAPSQALLNTSCSGPLQALEGLGLGLVVAHSGLSFWRQFAMVAAYALTCPVGIAVGVGISATYDSHSVTARAVQVRVHVVR